MMRVQPIPPGPEAVTPEWLTAALKSEGVISGATVLAFEMSMPGEGQGFAGRIARFVLHYDKHEARAPRSVIAKFPTADPTAGALARQYRVCEREIRFYKDIADTAGIPTPRCYYTALDTESGDGVMLLEDLSDARVGDNVAGCSQEEAELALRNLAKLHSKWWENPRLEELDWMPLFDDNADMIQSLYGQMLWDAFLGQVEKTFPGRELPAPLLSIGERLRENLAGVIHRLSEQPRTLVHGDYRLDNLFFATTEDRAPLTVIDWQVAVRGRGAIDLRHFLIYSFGPEERRSTEMTLLEMYHSTLRDQGIEDYAFDECFFDYRLAGLYQVAMMALGVGILGVLSTAAGRDRFETSLERCVAAIEDHHLEELLP